MHRNSAWREHVSRHDGQREHRSKTRTSRANPGRRCLRRWHAYISFKKVFVDELLYFANVGDTTVSSSHSSIANVATLLCLHQGRFDTTVSSTLLCLHQVWRHYCVFIRCGDTNVHGDTTVSSSHSSVANVATLLCLHPWWRHGSVETLANTIVHQQKCVTFLKISFQWMMDTAIHKLPQRKSNTCAL
jgi:hypothetical protein